MAGANQENRTIRGTIAFVENRNANRSYPEMASPGFVGVYDLDLGTIGLLTPHADSPLIAAARQAAHAPSVNDDSVFVVLNPTGEPFTVRFAGTIKGNSMTGQWSTQNLLGGGGTFVMHHIAPDASGKPIS